MNIATPAETTQIVTIPKETALSVFTTEKAIDPFMARIRAEIDAFVPDITSAAGRKAVASMAYKVAQSKTYLEGVGKDLAAEAKEIPKKIDACRKQVRDTLDQWRDEVRKPLTDWETAEEARVKKHTDAITVLNELSRTAAGLGSPMLREGLAIVDAVAIGPACEEFETDYARAKEAARAALSEEIPKAEKKEAEAAELIRLREETARRAELDRIAEIQREAAEKAKREAEAEAQRKIDAEKVAAEKAQADAAAEAQQKLDEQTAATRRAEEEAAAAQQRAAETEARLKREADEKARREAAEAEAREANKRHRGAVNRKAVAAFVKGGMSEEMATLAVTLIAKKEVPNVTISY